MASLTTARPPAPRRAPAGSRRHRPYLLVLPLLSLYAVAFLLPFGMVVVESFRQTPDMLGNAAFPVLSQYRDFFAAPGAWEVIARTFRVTLFTTLACLLIGYPTASAILRLGARTRGIVLICVLSPLLMSLLSRTFGWWTILGPGPFGDWLGRMVLRREGNLLFTETAIVIGLVSVFIPFMVLSVMSALQAVDPETRRAARSLGASSWTVTRTIDIPLAMPGIVGGVLLVFAMSAGTYATPSILGGYQNTVVAFQAVNALQSDFNQPLSSAISVLLVTVALLATYLNLRLGRRYQTGSSTAGVFY
ncbi:ABC transporter permease [Phytohabitans kaempferiae]|uniref:ABC transporter permease n=1 Tax=Phytohabitans kaempferiae TaxID=1620943 RepID=A0ABV6MFB0_9ACTN